MVVKFHSGHCTTSNSPCARVSGADGLQVGFEQAKRTLCITRFEQLSCLVNKHFNIQFWYFWDRFRNYRCCNRLWEYLFHYFLLGNDDICCTFEFLNGEFVIIIMVMMYCFLKKVFRIFNSGFFGNRFNGFHVKVLLDFNGGFHDIHWNR